MPVFASQPIDLASVRDHYDLLSPLYRRFWGEHIHHGFWTGDESLRDAQQNLVEQLATRAGIPRGGHVLDVGCGFGGSSFWLARNLSCTVHGITLSATQVEVAKRRARRLGLGDSVTFTRADANTIDLPRESYDAVWTIECSEHLADKPAFFAKAATALRTDGVIAFCAWLGQPKDAEQTQRVTEICDAMLCPSLGSMDDHLQWLQSAGIKITFADDITSHVAQTWARARAILERPELRSIRAIGSPAVRRFCDAFVGMHEAYATGALAYGMVAGRKPGAFRHR